MFGGDIEGLDDAARCRAYLWPLGAKDQLADVVRIADRDLPHRLSLVGSKLEDESAGVSNLAEPTHQLQVLGLDWLEGGCRRTTVVPRRVRRTLSIASQIVSDSLRLDSSRR